MVEIEVHAELMRSLNEVRSRLGIVTPLLELLANTVHEKCAEDEWSRAVLQHCGALLDLAKRFDHVYETQAGIGGPVL
jgi:hypothetical protein